MVKLDDGHVGPGTKQEDVWTAGENKAVGIALALGVLSAGIARSLGGSLVLSLSVGFVALFSLWFVVALLQIVTRAVMVSVTAWIMAWQDSPQRAMSDEELAEEIEKLRKDMTEALPAIMDKAAKCGAARRRGKV